MSNLYFKVQQLNVHQSTHFNPVPRKIIDLNVYNGQDLVYSSVATNYLYQEKNNLLVDDRKQIKQSFLRTERGLLHFPTPRLPMQFINQIQTQSIKDLYVELIDHIPTQFRPHVQDNSEDFAFYSKLDSNQVPSTHQLFPKFAEWYQRLCTAYTERFSASNIEQEQNDIKQDEEILNEEKMVQTEEIICAVNFFRLTLQMPYIPPFSTAAKPVFKCFDYDNNRFMQTIIKKILKNETLQEIFQSSLSRRWELDSYSVQLNEANELIKQKQFKSDEEIKEFFNELSLPVPQFQSGTDLLLSNVFQFTKLMFNCKLISAQFFSTIICLFFGSQCYTYAEVRPFLAKQEGLFNWFLRKQGDLFEGIYKAGGLNKMIQALEFYVQELESLQKQPEKYEDEIEPVTQDTKEINRELFHILVFMKKLLETKQAGFRSFYTPTAKRIQKTLKTIKEMEDNKLTDLSKDIEKIIGKLMKR
ncbi:Conserved_hypothetical protein [Hexamita inflata]|uniref:Uncharacterized protein n=1 Tax=Hexamita inflata TaxID=28002 RepID=A0AA86TWQ8_9EUKA|nr:Conserved hypothetical protein [Hexamita inflata]